MSQDFTSLPQSPTGRVPCRELQSLRLCQTKRPRGLILRQHHDHRDADAPIGPIL